ncbi:MAG: dTMP kinase [Bifidobacteriaceae bacterium]|jgi:dTMP kinase|nr:dTMP kinase [Bifidobacteriaceae bacterium]
MLKNKGFFISFEGGDGTGKSTQAKIFYKWILENFDKKAVLTFEPGDSDFGREIRELVMHRKSPTQKDQITAKTQALLFASDRSYHIDNIILPALEQGKTVITDRYFDSSVAYQGDVGGLDDKSIYNLNMFASDGLIPDITFLIDRDINKALPQAKKTTGKKYDRFEDKNLAYHKQIRQKYLELANKKGSFAKRWCVIDGSGTIAEVNKKIIEAFLLKIKEIKSNNIV